MSELDTFKSNYNELPRDKGTEFNDGDQIDTNPDNLSENVVSLDEVKRRQLGRTSRIEEMRFERPKELTEHERAAEHIGSMGRNLAIHRARKAAA